MANQDECLESTRISPETVKRLVRDVVSLHKNPLTDQGIYYQHDEDNMLNGYALIIGPENTPYHHGFFFFKFIFPENYPFSPPKVIYMTNNGKTRFHPNLYRNGKTCLSILNTWRGEGWTSCQSIRSVLLTLVSILDENPLLNEPGVREDMKDVQPYKYIITYRVLEHANLFMTYEENLPSCFTPFYCYIRDYCNKHKNDILKKIKSNIKDDVEIIQTRMYNMSAYINYKRLYNKALSRYNEL